MKVCFGACMHTGSCTLAHAHARMLVHANILEIADIFVKACSFFCTRMFILVNAYSFFLCMVGCIPACACACSCACYCIGA